MRAWQRPASGSQLQLPFCAAGIYLSGSSGFSKGRQALSGIAPDEGSEDDGTRTMSNFAGVRVLALESRRAKEMASLITTYGGQPVLAPAIREIPLESNREALQFTSALLNGEFDMVIFLTGVGT